MTQKKPPVCRKQGAFFAYCLLPFYFPDGLMQGRKCLSVPPPDVESFTAQSFGPFHDAGARTVHVEKIEIDGSEPVHVAAQVPGDGQGFKEHLGHGHCAAVIEDHTFFHAGYGFGKDLEIRKGGRTCGRSVAEGMLMDDIATQGDVDGEGNTAFETVPGQTVFFVGQVFLVDHPSNGIAQTYSLLGSLIDGLIHHPSCFISHAEGAVFKTAGYMFGCLADEGDFEIMDGDRAVSCDVLNIAALHQIEDQSGTPFFDHGRPHLERDGTVVFFGFDHALGNGGDRCHGLRLIRIRQDHICQVKFIFPVGDGKCRDFAKVQHGMFQGCLGCCKVPKDNHKREG